MKRKGRKFVSSLEPLTLKWLSIIEFSEEESKRTKLRAQAIRLSNSGYNINQIVQICQAAPKTVSKWISEWEKHQFDSLIDNLRPGRTPLIPEDRHSEVIDIVKENPKQLKSAISTIEAVFGETISVKTLKRIIKKNFAGAEGGNL